MKKTIFAVFSSIILLTACKKDDPHGKPCPPGGKEQNWTKYAGNPVFVKSENSWDDGIILGHSVIKSGNTFKMWYGGGHSIESGTSIGYATSEDGKNWKRYNGNPVFEGKSGAWDELGVGVPIVLQEGDKLHMWYLAGGAGPDGGKFGYATSYDGINWERYPSPVFESLPGSWYRDALLPGAVIRENGVFKMWFSGSIGSLAQSTPTTENSIGYATSYNGINWTVYDNPSTTNAPYDFSDPVVKHGIPGEWDATSALSPSVIKTKCGYEMWYAGEIFSTGQQHLGYATSPDGIQWTKDADNPVLVTDSWNIALVFPSVILDKDKYRMWYGGFIFDGKSIGGAIGYATMPK